MWHYAGSCCITVKVSAVFWELKNRLHPNSILVKVEGSVLDYILGGKGGVGDPSHI